ncbi:uncharacterized protein BT62DRAFT_468708 [Guyanagaster necrorhizus]|uniref:Uncharacterized protein n=1 Tax=Guyanagaster necrorhizus TaxID=856835 RepID=A0A9P8ANG8_9AGAR|nr:uncharacterized protein BT62DRAFT_468708 [Guyanagaster necrorhizus MCA 3950]KAG7441890.1 hypothetical protein BT62DRAFT_468708 [Guyanagaster necrorhizus MCA 3950]
MHQYLNRRFSMEDRASFDIQSSRWREILQCQREWICLMLVMKLRQRAGMVWHRRCQPRWADRCRIVVCGMGKLIATGAMVLGLLVPLAVHEVRPVVGLVVWVMVYGAPEWHSFLRRLPIIVALLATEQVPSHPDVRVEDRRIIWSLARNIWIIIRDRECMPVHIEWMDRWRVTRYGINLVPPGHNFSTTFKWLSCYQ